MDAGEEKSSAETFADSSAAMPVVPPRPAESPSKVDKSSRRISFAEEVTVAETHHPDDYDRTNDAYDIEKNVVEMEMEVCPRLLCAACPLLLLSLLTPACIRTSPRRSRSDLGRRTQNSTPRWRPCGQRCGGDGGTAGKA